MPQPFSQVPYRECARVLAARANPGFFSINRDDEARNPWVTDVGFWFSPIGYYETAESFPHSCTPGNISESSAKYIDVDVQTTQR